MTARLDHIENRARVLSKKRFWSLLIDTILEVRIDLYQYVSLSLSLSLSLCVFFVGGASLLCLLRDGWKKQKKVMSVCDWWCYKRFPFHASPSFRLIIVKI